MALRTNLKNKKGSPLVSIIIPCFNSSKTILKAIKSCQKQTYSNLEVIVVDDGSSDETEKKIRTIKDKRIKIIKQKNLGASAARNRGLLHAKGKYIQFLDSDDFLGRDKIKGNLQQLEPLSGSKKIGLSDTVYFNDGENPESGIRQTGWPLVNHSNPTEWLVEMLGPEKGSMVQTSAWLTPRSIAHKIGPWNEKISLNDDGEYFARAVLNVDCICKSNIGETFYRKYRSQKSLSGTREKKHLKSGLKAIDLIASHLFKKTKSEKAKKAIARHYKEFAFFYYLDSPKIAEIALKKARKLGYNKMNPCFGTIFGRVLSFIFGWKNIKKLQAFIYKTKKL